MTDVNGSFHVTSQGSRNETSNDSSRDIIIVRGLSNNLRDILFPFKSLRKRVINGSERDENNSKIIIAMISSD